MIGSIIGDIVGCIYEFNNIKTKDFELFGEGCKFTDDSVLTVATADWILHGGDVATYYGNWGNAYPGRGYGSHFLEWLWDMADKGKAAPYDSCGNGSGMRVGPVGWAYNSIDMVMKKAKESSECSHDHPEGIKGAQAIAVAVFMARKGYDKQQIREKIEKLFGYDLSDTIDQLRRDYGWHSRYGNGGLCQASVPQAIVAFLDGDSFEDCIRNAVSIGGDSDTIACMTGSIAEAYYGIPDNIVSKALMLIPQEFKQIIFEFEEKYGGYMTVADEHRRAKRCRMGGIRDIVSGWAEKLSGK